MKEFDPEERIECRWVVDSETGYRYLMDLRTSKIIAKWTKEPIKKHLHHFGYNVELSTSECDIYSCICGKQIPEYNDLGGGC